MKFSDILRLALRNLREAKLRAGLTTTGVVIGVAVIVTMVSFGLGLQRNTVERFRELDLFSEVTVYGRGLSNLLEMQERLSGGGDPEGGQAQQGAPGEEGRRQEGERNNARPGERSSKRALDDAALAEIAKIPGVTFVEPNVSFNAYVRANNRARRQLVGGVRVPNAATRFRNFDAGRMVAAPDAEEAVVDKAFLDAFGFKTAEEAVGQTVELLAPQQGGDDEQGQPDDEGSLSFFGLPLEDESAAPENDAEGGLVARRFRIVGVLKNEVEAAGSGGVGGNRRFRGLLPDSNVYVPLRFANELAATNLNALDRVAVELARQSGALGEGQGIGYQSATVRVDDPVRVKEVVKRLDESGFSSFSLFSQLDEIRTVFLIMNSALGLLGSISLLVASFGIANTMIMSILERTREIGIMKAVGAEDREIKLIFFVEAAVVGLAGGTVGALLAWGFTKLANALVFRFVLRPRGASFLDFFSLPPYLWLGAILFAMLVAILAALYPASRAARIDPVRALRHD
ncbi:MAG TPA: FtsX-like permease family protein [Pyrinomonadaceae bacterium]|nr:FtsX-like permease family protein [Pyrinomonadaceae bacterium]